MCKRNLLFVTLSIMTFALLGLDNTLIGQTIDDLIDGQMIKKDRKKIKSFENQEKKALRLMLEVDEYYEEMGFIKEEVDKEQDKNTREKLLAKSVKLEQKAISDHLNALKALGNIYVNKYEIYKNDLRKFPKTKVVERALELRNLEEKAYDCFENADLFVQKVYYTLNQTELFKLFTEAYNQERLGLLYQQKIYAIQLNLNQNLIGDIDDAIAGSISKKPGKKNQGKKVVIPAKDTVHYTEVIVFDTVKVEKYIETLVVYKVQIAASKKLLSIEDLREIYEEANFIQYEFEKGWYKYSIGFFTNYDEAQSFKTKIGVPGAFVVAYNNGLKVPIKEMLNHPSLKK